MASPTLSIVAPAYNEERNLHAFLAAMIPVLEGIGETFEIIFIDDGSKDNTLGMLAAAASQDPRIKVVGLARNFGKDIALSAGLAHATGRAIIPIDCDLQHPPELIPQFVARWREGFDMVLGVRSVRNEESFVRRNLSKAYYRVMRAMTSVEIPPNAGDFRLIDRKILDIINKMPERHRFMKGIFAWPGFKVTSIEFQANLRANETRTTWSFFKLWRFALDGLFSFSTAPLKLWTYIGALSAGGAFLYLLITVIQKLFWGITVPGYASLLIVLLFFNGLLLISNGIQGEYIARIFEEVKGRPLYVVGQLFGFDASHTTGVPVPMPATSTMPHAAPPPSNNSTQIGLASGPQPLPTYTPPPVPARVQSPSTAPPITAPMPPMEPPRARTPSMAPLISAPPPVIQRPQTEPPRPPPVEPERARTPSAPPPSAGPARAQTPSAEPARAHTPSMPPPSAEPARARTPSMPPPSAEPARARTPSMSGERPLPGVGPARTHAPSSPPPVAEPAPPMAAAPSEPAAADTTVPTPTTEPAPITRPRHELPKPKGPPLPR